MNYTGIRKNKRPLSRHGSPSIIPTGLFLETKSYASGQTKNNQETRYAQPENPAEDKVQQVQSKGCPGNQALRQLSKKPRFSIRNTSNNNFNGQPVNHSDNRVTKI